MTLLSARIHDLSGNVVHLQDFNVLFEDMNHRQPQPTLGKKLLSEVVLATPGDKPTTRLVPNYFCFI